MLGKEPRRAVLLWLGLFAILCAGAASAWIWPRNKIAPPKPLLHEQIVTGGCGPVLSPDGRVYFTADMDDLGQSGQLYNCMLDGTCERRVRITPPERYAFERGGMTFSTNPSRCFFAYYILGVAECFGEGVLEAPDRLHILVRDIPGVIGDRAFVSRDSRLCFHLTRVSGRHLNCALSAIDSTGSLGPPLWFADPPIDSQYYSCDWAPNSNRFAFVDIGSRGRFMGDKGSPLYVLDLKRRVLTDKYLLPGVRVSGVAWSPDGRWIAFHVSDVRVNSVSQPDSPMINAVCVLDLASGRTWRLSRCDNRPQWTPDMAYLVYDWYGYILRLDWRRALADTAVEVPMMHTRLVCKPQPQASARKGAVTR